MSSHNYRWAWSQPLQATRLLVLLNLVERANDAAQCYPSVARIGQDTGLNRKTVIGALADLEAAGLIQKSRQAGTSTRYVLNLQHQAAPVPKTAPVPETVPVPKTGRGSPETGSGTRPDFGTQNPPPNPPITPQERTSAKSPGDPPAITSPPSSAKPRKRSLPDGFGISPAVRRWAEAKGYGQLEHHYEAFVLKAEARGYQYVDWDAALKTAIREDWAGLRGSQPYRSHPGPPRHATHQPPVSAVERARQSADDWLRARQPCNVIELNEYRTA